MYSIQLYRDPATNVFSRNPIPFSFRITPYTINTNAEALKVSIIVQFANNIGTPSFVNVWQGEITPDANGLCHIDISSIIDPLLKFYIPNLNIRKIQKADGQCGKFRISYFVTKGGETVSSVTTTHPYNVYKGGMSIEYHDKDSTYLNNQLIANSKAMHFHVPNEPIRWNEVKWLWFIYADPTAFYNLYLSIYIETDIPGIWDESEIFFQNMTLTQGQVYCVRTDLIFSTYLINYNNLDDPYLARTCSLRIYTSNSQSGYGPLLLPAVHLTIDNRPFEHEKFLQYRNSLGALETQSILGEEEIGTSIQSANIELVPIANEIGNYVVENTIKMEYSTHNPTSKASTGWISKPNLQRLVDLLLNKESYLVHANRIIPIQINTGSIALYKNKDKLFNLTFDYSAAFDDENFSIENAINYAHACPAIDFFEVSQQYSGGLTITWKLPYSLSQMQITYSGTSAGNPNISGTQILNGNSGSVNIYLLDTNTSTTYNFTITARVVCDAEVAPGSYGPLTTVNSFVLKSIIPPIANNDVADESPRNTTPRILQFNNADLNILNNDLPKTIPEVEFYRFVTAAGALTTTSANGANISYLTGNKIQYTPTGGSIAILAEDIIYYQCREAIGNVGMPYTYSNIASIRVPLTGQVYKVFVKMSLVNVYTQNVPYAQPTNPSGYTFDETIADVYLQFFTDSNFTIPIDVTFYGLILGYNISHEWTQYSGGVNMGTGFTANVSTGTAPLVGTSMLLFPSLKLTEWQPNPIQKLHNKKFSRNLLTSAGNFEIVGPTF